MQSKKSRANKAKKARSPKAQTSTTPAVAEPVEAAPDVAEPVEAAPDVAEPVEASPVVAEPVEAVPVVAEQPAQKAGGKKSRATKAKSTKAKSTKAKSTKASKAAVPTETVETPVEVAPTETETTEVQQTAGGKRVRSFKVMLPGGETYEGRFTGLTPYQAANKALSKYYRETAKPKKQIRFTIRESTRGSKRNVYTYNGRREKLANPVEYSIKDGRTIVKKFKNRLVKVKKSELETVEV